MVGDLNQNAISDRIMKFARENGLINLYWECNISIGEFEKTHVTGSNQIDAVFGSDEVKQYTEGRKLVDFNKIILTDHRGFLFDLD